MISHVSNGSIPDEKTLRELTFAQRRSDRTAKKKKNALNRQRRAIDSLNGYTDDYSRSKDEVHKEIGAMYDRQLEKVKERTRPIEFGVDDTTTIVESEIPPRILFKLPNPAFLTPHAIERARRIEDDTKDADNVIWLKSFIDAQELLVLNTTKPQCAQVISTLTPREAKELCSICLGQFDANRSLKLIRFHCGHVLHKICLKKLVSNPKALNKDLCPMCRQGYSLMADEGIPQLLEWDNNESDDEMMGSVSQPPPEEDEDLIDFVDESTSRNRRR